MARNKNLLSTRSHRLVMRATVTSYLFLAPFLVFFIMFVLYPMFMCVFTSLSDATMGREDIFIGLENYKTLLWEKNIADDGTVTYGDPVFWKALKKFKKN